MPEEGQQGQVIPVKVALRCRPLIPKETDEGCQTCLSFISGEPQLILGTNKSFTYDFVFSPDTPQHEFYDNAVAPLVNGIFKGYNATVLAYGQTGSGKTFSMGGGYGVSIDTDESIVGVIPRVIRSLFDGIASRTEFDFDVKVSYLEIYKEDLMDLLLPIEKREKDTVTIREDNSGIKLSGLTELSVKSVEETMQCLESGSHSRTTGSTAMNNNSSRSHAIFTIYIERTNKTDSQDFCCCKFHLVDLAGSERQKKTRAEGERLKEGININKGLLALGNVISALGDENQRNKHVPYRDSKLTRLLQDSLGGNSHTVMIACVSPADSNMEETLSTLRYADRARKIKNKPVVNRDPQVAEIIRLRQLVGDLQAQLLSSGKPILKQEMSVTPIQDSESVKEVREKNLQLLEKNRSLQLELEQLWEQNEQHCTRIIVLETRKDALQEKLDQLRSKLVDLNANAPEDDKLAVAIKDMIKDLMGQIDDIERTQNENLEHYLQSINESQDGSNQSDGEESKADQDNDKPKTEIDKFSEEMKEKFNERRAQLSRDLGELNKKLQLKQSRADDMKLSNEMYEQIKGEYEENIKKLNGQIDNLQAEKGNLENQLQEKKVASNAAKVNEQRRKRIQELEADVTKKRKEILEAKKMIKMKEQTVKDSEKLAQEIQALKSQRVQLMKQMKADGDAFRKFKQQKDKEVLQLKAKERKREVEISKLQRHNTQQQNILKRKNEETNALTRRLNEALMKQKKVLEERVKKEETQVSIGKGANVKKSLGNELEIMVGLQEAKEHKEELVQDRAGITKQLSKLRKQIENFGPANKKKILNDSSEKEMDEEKQKIEQEIREFENHLALKNSSINDISSKILELEGDSNEKLKRSRFQDIKTLVDARIGLNYLLQAASASKVEARKVKNEVQTVKESNDDMVNQIETLVKESEDQRQKHEDELEELQQMHENKTLFMLKQMQTRSNKPGRRSDGIGNTDDFAVRLKFQEEEINKLSHLKDSLQTKDNELKNLKKQLTKFTYRNNTGVGLSTSLMPNLDSDSGPNTPTFVNKKASFFNSAVLTTPQIKPATDVDTAHTNKGQKRNPPPVDEEEYYYDEEDYDCLEEANDDVDCTNDVDWQQGLTPGYASKTMNYFPNKKKVKGPRIPSVRDSPSSSTGECCGCKSSCSSKRCKCRKIDAFCGDWCECSGDKCTNREIQLPQSTTDNDSISNMNVTFVKDTSSTMSDSSTDVLKDTSNIEDYNFKNKRSLPTSDESSIARKYRRSNSEKDVTCSSDGADTNTSDNVDLSLAMKQKKRKLGSKKPGFFSQPL